ncbi:MAG: hypothetical protein IK124_08880, partial [Prevotella sp.]|nr:hypothetical protein [Prevotella sp.]
MQRYKHFSNPAIAKRQKTPAGPKGPFGPTCGPLLHALRAPRISSSCIFLACVFSLSNKFIKYRDNGTTGQIAFLQLQKWGSYEIIYYNY